ncbi:hypothetical protein FTUN_7522 [Frigoriglobus tundricola]|uniref:Uncharacterized protein n=1 Tax=Frigoriglobus tundricola TaxID=2774151 RepID=A0A6M5Z0N8_9BACT|nr:hypothetical protein FTUN_7522 [Frigoriglobus tundricola]
MFHPWVAVRTVAVQFRRACWVKTTARKTLPGTAAVSVCGIGRVPDSTEPVFVQ